jgi:hypothetical protein
MEGRSPERRAQVGDTVAIDGSFDPVERRSPARCTQTAAAQTAATRKQQRRSARRKFVRPQGARVLAATVPPLVENPALPWFLPCSLPWSKTRGRHEGTLQNWKNVAKRALVRSCEFAETDESQKKWEKCCMAARVLTHRPPGLLYGKWLKKNVFP